MIVISTRWQGLAVVLIEVVWPVRSGPIDCPLRMEMHLNLLSLRLRAIPAKIL